MTRDRLVGWWRFHSPRQLRRMLAIAVRAEAERDAARAEADDLRRQLLNETYRPEGGEIVMRELGKVKRERDAARAEAERLRERTHEIADEANRRYAPYVSRCAEFDNQIAAAREHFSRYAFPEPFSGVPRTWWDMTSQYNRLALMEIIGQRDAAVAEAARVREALQAARDLHVAGRCGCDPNSPHSTGHCRVCGIKAGWPCATVRALDAALDGSE